MLAPNMLQPRQMATLLPNSQAFGLVIEAYRDLLAYKGSQTVKEL